jgi:hypothetical protein
MSCLKDIFQILRALGMYHFLYVEFSKFYVYQYLAGQTLTFNAITIRHSRSFWDRVGYDFFFSCWSKFFFLSMSVRHLLATALPDLLF